MQLGVENKDGQSLVENILLDAVHEIIESKEIDELLNGCEKKVPGLIETNTNQDQPPSCDILQTSTYDEYLQYKNQNISKYEEELKAVSGMDDKELFRKRMFMEKPFVDLIEFMLEDTLFNLMEEATYEEFDLT